MVRPCHHKSEEFPTCNSGDACPWAPYWYRAEIAKRDAVIASLKKKKKASPTKKTTTKTKSGIRKAEWTKDAFDVVWDTPSKKAIKRRGR